MAPARRSDPAAPAREDSLASPTRLEPAIAQSARVISLNRDVARLQARVLNLEGSYRTIRRNDRGRGHSLGNALAVHAARLDRLERFVASLASNEDRLMQAFDAWGRHCNPNRTSRENIRLILRISEAYDRFDEFPLDRMFPRLTTREEEEAAVAAADQEGANMDAAGAAE